MSGLLRTALIAAERGSVLGPTIALVGRVSSAQVGRQVVPERRVLIVEDERLFSDMLRRTLDADSEISVVGVCSTAEDAVALARSETPDAVIMDIELQGELDGIDAALQIKRDSPKVGIVILSSHLDRRYVSSLPLEEQPGWAYLLKQSVPNVEALLRAIEGSINGMVVLDPAVVASLQPRQGSALARLAPRQREVLQLMAEGYSNAAIAERMTITPKSVETYVNAIYQELGLSGEAGVSARVRATLIYLQESEANR